MFSPFSVTFEILVSFSHLIIHPIHEWSWFQWQFQLCFIVSNDELLRSCLFLRIDFRSPRSVRKYFQVPHGLRGSVETSFLVTEKPSRTSRIIFQEILSGRPDRFVCLNISVPLLRRPSAVVIPLWVACWGRTFNKMFMIVVVGSFELVCADIKSPRSLLFLSNWTPGISTITSLPRAYRSRRRYVRRRPCNRIHHWSWFCCDSFFSWIVLRSFRHCIRAH